MLLYTVDEQSENGIKKTIPFKITSKNNILRDKFNKKNATLTLKTTNMMKEIKDLNKWKDPVFMNWKT